MIQVTEPQVWTLIGVFTAALFAMMTLMSTMFLNVVRAEIGGLRGEMNARLEAIDAKFEVKFEVMETKIDNLDRDIQALMRHTFPDRP